MTQQVKISIALLRVALGGLFLWSGVYKAASGFTATGFLLQSSGPLAAFYTSLAGNVVVDFLVVFGELGIGFALVFGILTRFASICGMLMMSLFYCATLPQPQGILNDQLIYLLTFFLLFSARAGEFWGVDTVLKHLPWYSESKLFQKIIG